ncbi:MAG: DUF2752 domain-containing protein [Balneolales bacterium]|nr:DUF2752 domain-containing protein [Balneolales bacterium]
MTRFFLTWGLVIAGIAFVLSIDLHHPGESLCYSQRLFGLACPACGMGRAFNALLHIHLFRAVAFNPLVLPAAFFVGSLMVATLSDFIRKTNYTQRLMRFRLSKPVAILAVLVVLAVWVRNLFIY